MNPPQGTVVILDRDGTIVVDRGYLAEPDGLEFLPTAPDALRWLSAHDCPLIVITNQSGLGRGYFDIDALEAVNARLRTMIDETGVTLAGIYYCPHAPETHCACRKPQQALMQQAAADHHFDPRESVVIGDKASDIEFGHRAGAKTILISSDLNNRGVFCSTTVVPNLLEAARLVTE